MSVLDAAVEDRKPLEWRVIDTTPDGYGPRVLRLVDIMAGCLVDDVDARSKLDTVVAQLDALRSKE